LPETDTDAGAEAAEPEKSKPDNRQNKQRKVRQAPEGAQIPKKRFRKLLYRFNSEVLKRPDWVPKPDKKERMQLARDGSIRRLAELCDQMPRMTVCFVNSKGAGATTATQVYTVSVLHQVVDVIVGSADFNLASGNSAKRLGRTYENTITQKGLLSLTDNDLQPSEFLSHLRPSRYGVRVVSSDPIIDRDQTLSEADTGRALWALKEHCEYLYLDTMNKITDPVTLKVVEQADVIVFTANVAVQESLRQLATSMETLRRHGYEDKVNKSVVVISNIPRGKRLSEYRKFLNETNIEDRVDTQLDHLFVGQFLGVPHDPAIELDGEVDLEALAWETCQAYIELNIAIFTQAAKLRNTWPEMAARQW
jgi:cellulose biosynthesis protein BcsQ